MNSVTEPVVIEVDALSTFVLSVPAVGCSAVVVVPPLDLDVGRPQIKLSCSNVGRSLARLDGHAGTVSRSNNDESEGCAGNSCEMHIRSVLKEKTTADFVAVYDVRAFHMARKGAWV